jgi:hypothetical protein
MHEVAGRWEQSDARKGEEPAARGDAADAGRHERSLEPGATADVFPAPRTGDDSA